MKGICKANNKYSQYLIDIFVEYVVKTELSEYKMTVDWTDVYVLINYDTTEWQSFFFFLLTYLFYSIATEFQNLLTCCQL